MKYTIRFLRYLKGYVQIKVTGGFQERFLNLCSSMGIILWDLSLSNDVLICCICRKDFLKLRTVVDKSGVKVAIIKKTGLIYRYRKYNNRIGLIIGITLFAIIHLILNMFVWCVDVKGNTTISTSEILSCAEQYGLREGTVKNGFDEIRASRNIAAAYDGKITWLSINIKGSLAVIELREDSNAITQTKEKAPCNIVADFDGVILSAETYYGDCMVKKGTGVRKGDLLISGAIINEDMSTTFYSAKGKITALHDKEIIISETNESNPSAFEIISKRLIIGFFGIELPQKITTEEKDSIVFSEKKTLNINGYNLPFSIEKHIICKKSEENTAHGYIEELEEIQHRVYKENANSTVVSKDENLSIKKGEVCFTGRYTLIDFLGEEKHILSE